LPAFEAKKIATNSPLQMFKYILMLMLQNINLQLAVFQLAKGKGQLAVGKGSLQTAVYTMRQKYIFE
jgi:hypothetical protein